MKKLLLILALLLSSCTSVSQEANNACTPPEGTYAEYTTQTWQDLSYHLPYCWEAASPAEGELLLTKGDGKNEMYIHYEEPDPETDGRTVRTKSNPEGKKLYIEVLDPEDEDAQLIIDSITFN